MTVLVTGGAGYIGSHMVLALMDAGEPVVVLDNLSTGFRWAVPRNAFFVFGDCGDRENCARILHDHKVDAIIHFAALSVSAESVTQPMRYFRNNCNNSLELIEAAVMTGTKHFILSSSASVYGNARVSPIGEHAPLVPISPYGMSKLITEMMLGGIADAHDLRYVNLRYFNVAGADPQGRSGESTDPATHLIKIACQAGSGKRTEVQIYGTDYATRDGTAVRDYIHVTDLVDAHMAALRYLRAGGTSDIFNCGYGHGYSVRDVIESVRYASGQNFAIREAPRRPGDPSTLVAATEKIRRVLNWTPKYDSIDTIVRDALAWEEHLLRASKNQ